MEAFTDRNQATLVANHSRYLNVYSFDYIEMLSSTKGQCADGSHTQGPYTDTTFALVQDNRCLCLTPIAKDIDQYATRDIDAAALEAIVTDALSASWDASIDDECNL